MAKLESKRLLVLGVFYGLIWFPTLFNIEKMLFLAKVIVTMIGNADGRYESVGILVCVGERK